MTLLHIAIAAARRASDEIIQAKSSDDGLIVKSDHTPQTVADRMAHAAINEILSKSGIPVLSEEGHDVGATYERTYWLVDPLDGTRSFRSGSPDFGVSIALIEGGFPVLAVVRLPRYEKLYFAEAGKGAFLISNDSFKISDVIGNATRLPLHVSKHPNILVYSSNRSNQEQDQFISSLKKKVPNLDVKRVSALRKFCMIAEGVADFYSCFVETFFWDTAGGQLIVEESGGRVVDAIAGRRLQYLPKNPAKSSCVNPSFIVYASSVTSRPDLIERMAD